MRTATIGHRIDNLAGEKVTPEIRRQLKSQDDSKTLPLYQVLATINHTPLGISFIITLRNNSSICFHKLGTAYDI